MGRGQLSDLISPLILILMVGILAVVFYYIFDAVEPELASISGTAGELMGDAKSMYSGFDTAMAFILLCAFASSIITGIFVESHPLFFVLAVVFLIFAVVGAGLIANVWDIFGEVSIFSSIIDTNFTITTLIFTNAPLLIGASVVFWSIGFYAKNRFFT